MVNHDMEFLSNMSKVIQIRTQILLIVSCMNIFACLYLTFEFLFYLGNRILNSFFAVHLNFDQYC